MTTKRRPLDGIVDPRIETRIHDALADLFGDRQFAGRLLRAVGKASLATASPPVYEPEDAAQGLLNWLLAHPGKPVKWAGAGKSTKFLTKVLTNVAKETGRTVASGHDYRSGSNRVQTKVKSLEALAWDANAEAFADGRDGAVSIEDVIGEPSGRPLKPFRVLLPDCEYRLFEHEGYLPVLEPAYAPVAPVGDRDTWVVRPWWYRSGPHTWVCEGWVDGEYQVVTTETRLSAGTINDRHAAFWSLSPLERLLLLDKYASFGAGCQPPSDELIGQWNDLHRNTVATVIRQAKEKLVQGIVSDVTKEFALAA